MGKKMEANRQKKKELRRQILEARDQLKPDARTEYSRRIKHKLKMHRLYQKAETVLSFVSFGSEVDTVEIISAALQDGKKVYCPRVEGEELQFYRILCRQDLQPGYKGIWEPTGTTERFSPEKKEDLKKSLVLIPGVVFDKNRNRIGYGKGFYDRFLSRYPGIPSIAVAYSCQLAEKVPGEEHDKRPDVLITEQD